MAKLTPQSNLRLSRKDQIMEVHESSLMWLVREHIADGKVLGLVESFLKQGVIEGNDWQEAKEEGTPQGGVI